MRVHLLSSLPRISNFRLFCFFIFEQYTVIEIGSIMIHEFILFLFFFTTDDARFGLESAIFQNIFCAFMWCFWRVLISTKKSGLLSDPFQFDEEYLVHWWPGLRNYDHNHRSLISSLFQLLPSLRYNSYTFSLFHFHYHAFAALSILY